MTDSRGSDCDARVADEHEALWTRLFAAWLEQQTELVLPELERGDSNGSGASDRPARGADSKGRGR